MTSQAKRILQEDMKLDARERVELVAELQESLTAVDLGDEWEAEIRRRIDEVDSGRAETVPAEDVFSRLEKRFGGK